MLAEATNVQYRLLAFEYACNYTGTSSQSSSVSIVIGYELDDRILIPSRGREFFCCPEQSCQVCSSPSLLFSAYHFLVQHRYFWCGAELTTVPHLVPRFRVSESKSLFQHVSSWPAQYDFHLYWHRQARCWLILLQFYFQWKEHKYSIYCHIKNVCGILQAFYTVSLQEFKRRKIKLLSLQLVGIWD